MSSADLGMLCNVLGMLGNVLGQPRHALQRPRHACNILGDTWWYTTPLTSQLIRQQVGGFLFDVRLLGPCKKHVEISQGCCKHA